MKIRFISLSVLILALTATMPTMAASVAAPTKRVLALGRISNKPDKHHANLKLMADYLAGQLKDLGIEEGRAVIAKDADQMVQFFKEGRVDVTNETVFAATRLMESAGATLLLKSHRKGAAFYRTVFFTHKNSGIKSIKDLRGRIIAFEDRNSTAGYVIPASVLIAQGFELVRLESPRQSVPAGRIGYFFSGEEINSAVLVHKGIVHAGVYGNADFVSEGSMPAEIRSDMRIFHETADFPRSLILARQGLKPEIKERLKQVLIKAPTDARAIPLLVDYHRTTKFEAITKDDLAGIEEARRLGAMVRDRLE